MFNSNIISDFCCFRFNHILCDWQQHCALQPHAGELQPRQEEEQDYLPPHHPGRCHGDHVPNGWYHHEKVHHLTFQNIFYRPDDLGDIGQGMVGWPRVLQDV